MRVVATPEAVEFIAARGGVAYVRPLRRKCCGGSMTVLSATTQAPADAARYEAVGDRTLGVRYWRPGPPGRGGTLAARPPADAVSGGEPVGPAGGETSHPAAGETSHPARGEPFGPEELLIELKGHRRPRLIACWDGCLFKI
jgi:hypothetical protein